MTSKPKGTRWMLLCLWIGLAGCGTAPPPATPQPASAPSGAGMDFLSALDHAAEELAAKVGKQKVTLGMIREKETQARLQLSDTLSDELTVALRNRGVEMVVAGKDIEAIEERLRTAGIAGASAVIIGQFQKWGSVYRITYQIVDTGSSQVIGGVSVNVNAADITPEMLKPVQAGNRLAAKGIASISHQCDPAEENPCPPPTELKRRAIEAAKILAMQDIATKTGVDLNSLSLALNGRAGRNFVVTSSAKQLKNLRYQEPVVAGDEVSVEVIADVVEVP